VARTAVDDTAGMSCAEVIHDHFTALPATATVADVRAWFAESSHRRMAFLADQGRYAGSVTPADIGADVAGDRAATEVAHQGPTIAPDEPARAGYELALETDARRVPVVAADGRLLGVVAVTQDLAGFCGQ
jgi:CBS domain-containing protein